MVLSHSYFYDCSNVFSQWSVNKFETARKGIERLVYDDGQT